MEAKHSDLCCLTVGLLPSVPRVIEADHSEPSRLTVGLLPIVPHFIEADYSQLSVVQLSAYCLMYHVS